MNNGKTSAPWTAVDQFSVLLVVVSFILVCFHFRDSCAASGRALLAGSIVAIVSFVLGVAKKNGKVMLASALAVLAHMLLAH